MKTNYEIHYKLDTLDSEEFNVIVSNTNPLDAIYYLSNNFLNNKVLILSILPTKTKLLENINLIMEQNLTKEEISIWDKLMICKNNEQLNDLYNNINSSEILFGIKDKINPDYWNLVAKKILLIYKNK